LVGSFQDARAQREDAAMRSRWRRLLSPLRVPACRTLFGAQAVSGVGDWAGRLALAAIVYQRSGAAWTAAVVTVAALVPWLGPGQLLATFADRYGRIRVLVAADLARAALFGLMLVRQPVWSLLVLAFLAGLCVPPFVGARSAALVELTPPDTYPAALSLYGVLAQSEIIVGYLLGGLAIASVGPRGALAANALTFLVSSAFIVGLRGTPAGNRQSLAPLGIAGVRAGVTVWRRDPLCRRSLALFVGVSMCTALPEALVVPFSDHIGISPRAVGALAAVIAIGTILGMVTAPSAPTQSELLQAAGRRVAAVSGVAGALFALGVSPLLAGVAFLVSGLADAIAVPTNQVVGERLPVDGRAAAMSVAGGLQYGAQALTIAVAGVMASVWSPRLPLVAGMFAAAAVGAWAAWSPVRPAATAVELQHA
jgi:MFS family permease